MNDALTAALLVPWLVVVVVFLRTRDWRAMKAAVRADPRALIGYTLVALALIATCPIWPLLTP